VINIVQLKTYLKDIAKLKLTSLDFRPL